MIVGRSYAPVVSVKFEKVAKTSNFRSNLSGWFSSRAISTLRKPAT